MEIVSHQCAFSDVSEHYNFMTKFYHNGCIGIDTPRCLFYYTLQEKSSTRKPYHKDCIEMVSPQIEFSGVVLVASQ